ncbi:MAG: hypothetical protein LT070_03330 [Solirubrobacteraceae bacterium]|nr:hypothetical protein [Solirubrobacteraceae bacterium]
MAETAATDVIVGGAVVGVGAATALELAGDPDPLRPGRFRYGPPDRYRPAPA